MKTGLIVSAERIYFVHRATIWLLLSLSSAKTSELPLFLTPVLDADDVFKLDQNWIMPTMDGGGQSKLVLTVNPQPPRHFYRNTTGTYIELEKLYFKPGCIQ